MVRSLRLDHHVGDAIETGVQILVESDSRNSGMLFAHVKAACDGFELSHVVLAGADGFNRGKGHYYFTAMANLVTKRCLFATSDKDSLVWEALSGESPRHNGRPKAIRYAVMDIGAAYIEKVSDNLEYAQLVYDEFQSHRLCGVGLQTSPKDREAG